MSSSSGKRTLQSEKSNESTGRPTKFFKLDRTYSDVVEDELYDPQPEASKTSPTAANATVPKTQRIQNAYPQLFTTNNGSAADDKDEDSKYWPGMESSIRFDRGGRNGRGNDQGIIADKKQKLQSQPEQSTVSPKEAFLDYQDNAPEYHSSSVFETSNTRQNSGTSDTSDVSTTTQSKRPTLFPTLSSMEGFGEISPPKTITPVRQRGQLSPRPVTQRVTEPLHGPSPSQAKDNTRANAQIRALYKEDSSLSAMSNDPDSTLTPKSTGDIDPDYMPPSNPSYTSRHSRPNNPAPPTSNGLYCETCEAQFDKVTALNQHRKTHAVWQLEYRAARSGPIVSNNGTIVTRNADNDNDNDNGNDNDEGDEEYADQEDDNSDASPGSRSYSVAPSHHNNNNPNKSSNPHRCDWVIPATGKVCGVVFSRPYDLVRHQDTIHRAKKLEFKCEECIKNGINKVFSRNDALVRHMRHVHKKELKRV